jgi:hypothetical protein
VPQRRVPACWLAFAATLVAAAATGSEFRVAMPAPPELAERSGEVLDRVAENARLLEGGNEERQLSRLDATLNSVAVRYGEESIELSQAATETGVLLIRAGGRYDLAEPYIERALHLSRRIFGTDHRETGYALHDLAVVRHKARPTDFASRIEPLIREAIAVRRRVIGPEHKETAASEGTLAAFLVASWQRQTGGDTGSPLLTEADELVAHALPVMARELGHQHFEVTELRYLQVEIALARGDFDLAASLAKDLIDKHQQPCNGMGDRPSARQLLVRALRGAGRQAEADRIEREARAEKCGLEWLLPGLPAATAN